MRILARLHQLPPRLATGAYILHSGLTKAKADREGATAYHGMAANAYPFLRHHDPEQFTRLLAKAEITLGIALLIPVVPTLLAGAGLTAFAGGLLGFYLQTPGLRRPHSLKPSQEGIGVAKDIWLLGIGLGLILDELDR
jgi:uncharacterized membrane protein YphA (DoxX/SURF4 family)